MTRFILLAALLAAPALADSGPAADIAALREAIRKSAAAANRRDAAAILSQYAPDAILSYPTSGDTDYAKIAKGFERMTSPPSGLSMRTVPTIEEVLASGDLGVVRVSWTTTTTDARVSPAKVSTRVMKDLQVWRRGGDGAWKLSRAMHYRLSPPMVHAEQAAAK